MNKLIFTPLFILVLVSFSSCSNRVKNPHFVINEVLVINEGNFVDDYGRRSGWIEIFNNTARTQNIGGYFLTNDRSNPRKYAIPRGDVLTRVPPHQHVLFWANDKPHQGTFHVSFELDPDEENYIALYDESGEKLIDEVIIPKGQLADVSWGYEMDGKKYDDDRVDLITALTKVTPSTNNYTLDKNEKVERFKQHDKFGASMTMTSMLVVFSALILLFIVFWFVGNASSKASKKKREAALAGKPEEATSKDEITGEVLTAIFMALHEEQSNVHDIEHTVLTFNRVDRSYSPWSSKIYGLRELPRK